MKQKNLESEGELIIAQTKEILRGKYGLTLHNIIKTFADRHISEMDKGVFRGYVDVKIEEMQENRLFAIFKKVQTTGHRAIVYQMK